MSKDRKEWFERVAFTKQRIWTLREAWRCVRAIADYLRAHESPQAAQDLLDAANIIRRQGEDT